MRCLNDRATPLLLLRASAVKLGSRFLRAFSVSLCLRGRFCLDFVFAFIDPRKTRMLPYKVHYMVAPGSVVLILRLERETSCLLRQKPKHCGKLRSTDCTASWARKWSTLAAGTCRLSTHPAVDW